VRQFLTAADKPLTADSKMSSPANDKGVVARLRAVTGLLQSDYPKREKILTWGREAQADALLFG
jgi:hypothetical protein